MIDIALLRENPELVRENIKKKQERDKEISLRGAKESEGR